MKKKSVATFFAVVLGTLGAHKFYLGRPIWGVIYLLLCTTTIPTVLGLIEGLFLLLMSDEKFNKKYNSIAMELEAAKLKELQALRADKSHDRYGMPNYNRYAQYTSNRDWQAICELNNVDIDSFCTEKELKVLPNYLEDEEVVFALTSGVMTQTYTSSSSDWGLNTWLVVLTSERFLFLDHALLTSSVDTQSIRHDKVQAVSASQGWFLGKVIVDIGSRTVEIDNCKKATVAPIASLANKWLQAMEKQKNIQASSIVETTQMSVAEQLEKLSKLLSAGVLSDKEFATAKAKLLDSM